MLPHVHQDMHEIEINIDKIKTSMMDSSCKVHTPYSPYELGSTLDFLSTELKMVFDTEYVTVL